MRDRAKIKSIYGYSISPFRFRPEAMEAAQLGEVFLECHWEYCQATRSTETMPREHNEAHDQRWVPPNPGFFKVNVGGTFDAVSGRGGVGIVIRNDQGQIRSMRGALPFPTCGFS